MKKPKIPKYRIIEGHRYVTTGIAYRSRNIAIKKARDLRSKNYRARVHAINSHDGPVYILYVNDPREYYK